MADRQEIKITPNFSGLFEQHFKEFERSVRDLIREAVRTSDDQDHLTTVRGPLVHLNIAIQCIDSVELFTAFRPRLLAVVDDLVAADDKLTLDDEEDEPTEPEEEDLVTYDDKYFYTAGSHSVFDVKMRRNPAFVVGDGEDRDAAIRAYMDKEQFWPNVWSISDHGNAHLIKAYPHTSLASPQVEVKS